MAYVVKRSFYEGNTLHTEGAEFKHEDQAFVKKCLDDGNVVEAEQGGGSNSEAPLVQPPVVSGSPVVSQPPVEPTVAPQVPKPVDPMAQAIATDPQILG